jgi:predicted Co/Zn/Cd cation transporter (cation efflux family)
LSALALSSCDITPNSITTVRFHFNFSCVYALLIVLLGLSSAQDLVSLYVRANNFDSALSTGRVVGADLKTAFADLTTQCMNLAALGELA